MISVSHPYPKPRQPPRNAIFVFPYFLNTEHCILNKKTEIKLLITVLKVFTNCLNETVSVIVLCKDKFACVTSFNSSDFFEDKCLKSFIIYEVDSFLCVCSVFVLQAVIFPITSELTFVNNLLQKWVNKLSPRKCTVRLQYRIGVFLFLFTSFLLKLFTTNL